MFTLSHQFPMQSGVRTEAGQPDGVSLENHGKKVRFDFERFSSLPKEMFSFFSKATD